MKSPKDSFFDIGAGMGVHRYSTIEIPPEAVPSNEPARLVMSDPFAVGMSFCGVDPNSPYEVELTFLSDTTDRVVRILAGDKILEDELALPKFQVLRRRWPVPFEAYRQGRLGLDVRIEQGPSVPVAAVVVFSSDSNAKPLTRCSVPPEVQLETPRLTPRPETLEGVQPLQVGLNGTWQFNPRPPADWKGDAPEGDGWAPIQVPGEWAMQGFDVPPYGWAAYWRTFTVPTAWAGLRVKLECDAVYSLGRVFVNGREAGRTQAGGFAPHEFDVTSLLKTGKENRIGLLITSETVSNQLSYMSYYAQHPLGGITRKIYLFAVPPLNIKRLQAQTLFDKQYRDATLRVLLGLTNDGEAVAPDARVQFELTDPQGRAVPLESPTISIPALKAGATADRPVEFPVASPVTWDAEHPRLYKLTARLLRDGPDLERVSRRIGFRQVEIRGNQIFVNGRPIKLHGAERHEYHPYRGRSLTPEQWRVDIRQLREANMNFVFTSHYPNPEEFLDLCDEMGIWVAEEAPFVWVQPDSANSARLTKYFLENPLALVERDMSRPSIIYWQLGDECSWGENFAIMQKAVHQLDPTRPTDFAYQDGEKCPLASVHYPSVEKLTGMIKSGLHTPLILDQYGHLLSNARRETLTDPGLHDYYARALLPFYEEMYQAQGVAGGAIWEWIDDWFYLQPQVKRWKGIIDRETGLVLTGYGDWGFVDRWRRPKPEYWNVKKVYSPLRIREAALTRPPAGQPLRIPVENRFDFSNLSELRMVWEIGGRSGNTTADIPPRSSGILSIALPEEMRSAAELTLKFYYRDGMLIDAYRFPVTSDGKPPLPPRLPAFGVGGRPTVEQDKSILLIKGDDWQWTLDRARGSLQAEVGGVVVLRGGPRLGITAFDETEYSQINEVPTELQPELVGWSPSSTEVQDEGAVVRLQMKGESPEVSGGFTMRFDGRGAITIQYHFEYKGPEITPREIGLLFTVPRACDRLQWKRKALWSFYPEGHIGRPEGEARPFRDPLHWPTLKVGQPPVWPWELDSTGRGTRDFRSTKYDIYRAALLADEGAGVQVVSGGTQNVRAWVADEGVNLLVSPFSISRSVPFDRGFYPILEHKLRKGDVLEGMLQLQLVRHGSRTTEARRYFLRRSLMSILQQSSFWRGDAT